MRSILLTILCAVSIALISCSDEQGPQTDSFDRAEMLRSISDRLIIPAYTSAEESLDSLAVFYDEAIADGLLSTAEIDVLRARVATTTLRWQRIVTFNFGPAEGDLGTVAQEVSTFPCDTAAIEARISTSDTVFTDFRRDTRGLAALDYLVFATTSTETAQRLSGPAAQGRRQYLRAVIMHARSAIVGVATSWRSQYRDVFCSRTGTDAGSSVSLLFNEMNKSFELLKNFKLGLPLGLRAGQTASEPTKIEAYYSGRSYELIGLHFHSIKEIWSGKLSDGTVIPSFRDYLLTVVNGPRLVEDTEAQIARIDAAYLTVSQSQMDVLIRTNPQALMLLHTEMQKLTRFIKSEMSSLLGISITYSSGDGD